MKLQLVKILTAVMAMAVLCVPQLMAATSIGYSNGTAGRSSLFRLGFQTTQGMAIRLDGSKLKALKGCTISAIETVFCSRNSNDGTARLFIATSPGGTPLCEQTVEISKVASWVSYDLDTPYTIKGDEDELYVGYTVEIAANYVPLSADFSTDMRGTCFALSGDTWIDIYGMGFGCVNVKAVLADDVNFTDLALKPLSADGYYKEGTAYSYSGQLLNFGSETVNSFDMTITMGGGNPQKYSFKDTGIAAGSSYDFTLPEYTASASGMQTFRVEVTNINGADDADMSDNAYAQDLFFYPASMERCLLLEGFTGQDCSNCPDGHRNINTVVGASEIPVAEIMHHSGYYADIFTMSADSYYTFFFGGSTYAPGVMINRTTNPLVGSVPVMNTSVAYMTNTIDMLSDKQPYVSLGLTTDYDADSHEGVARLKVYVHNDLPMERNVLNVVLAQNNIKAYQSNGGSEYNHTMVFRGPLTGNVWGIEIPAEQAVAGSSIEYEKTFTIGETIYSDYWTDDFLASSRYSSDEVSIATDPDNMYITAYVSGYTQNEVDGNEIYNCVQVKLGENREQGGLTGIDSPQDSRDMQVSIRTEGRRIVVEGADSYAVYSAAGLREPDGCELGRGLYIVRATSDGRTVSRKVTVR